MATPAASRTRTDDVYASLRADILGGVFPPGERLKFRPLCTRYDASVSLVREVLSRLSEQGLVRANPQIGFQVTPISEADLLDLTDTRVDIECLALRHAIGRDDLAWRSKLVAAHYTLANTPRRDPADPGRVTPDWEAAHAEFHDVLLAGCGRERLYAIARGLRDSAKLYRRWSEALDEQDLERDPAAEHAAITDHALAGDADRAVAALADHIRLTTDLILNSRPGPSVER
ncbi:GntR family transcriptional regulator [Amycolatopsis rhabdoformis]|uniref:GntR family transcriptional regulator n=1 Tax=Amycolatopsis rhabdoformis TaxID=1448059 RepID=A0ABZ1IFD8_9PSEU|nr:GntR family transcriptional regulator [Amycolatopsis rhabdoformis]WSE32373.1 GntR family transcriptional regulator [Amycolatopsis rhabdoformis]